MPEPGGCPKSFADPLRTGLLNAALDAANFQPFFEVLTMSAKQDFIDARFDGRKVRFQIPRSEIAPMALHTFGISSPFEQLQKFAAGTWTVQQVEAVLNCSYAGRCSGYVPAVQEVLSSKPPGIYAPLAAKVLEAYLFGIDKERGAFDERKAAEA